MSAGSATFVQLTCHRACAGTSWSVKITLLWRRSGPHLMHMVLCVHPPQHPKRHLDRFSHFLHSSRHSDLYFTIGGQFP